MFEERLANLATAEAKFATLCAEVDAGVYEHVQPDDENDPDHFLWINSYCVDMVGPAELVREPSTPAIEAILNQLGRFSIEELEEVNEGLARIIKHKKNPNQHYLNWCANHDRWLGIPEPARC